MAAVLAVKHVLSRRFCASILPQRSLLASSYSQQRYSSFHRPLGPSHPVVVAPKLPILANCQWLTPYNVTQISVRPRGSFTGRELKADMLTNIIAAKATSMKNRGRGKRGGGGPPGMKRIIMKKQAKSARLDLDYKPLKRKKKVQKQQEDRPKIATLNFEEKLRPEQKEQRNRSMEGQRISLQRMRERRATLSRGYHGINIDGTRLKTEPPKIQDKYQYGEFETRILKIGRGSHMTSTKGRTSAFYTLAACGNKNGLLGIGLGRGTPVRITIKKAQQKAYNHLFFVERFENRTVMHDFYIKDHKTKMFVFRAREGLGLHCNRILKTICQLAGIKDIKVHIEGRVTNHRVVVRAFFNALVGQKTHQEAANIRRLNVVELKQENNFFPTVLARPDNPRFRVGHLEPKSYDRITMGKKELLLKKFTRKRQFYEDQTGYKYRRFIQYKRRNQHAALIERKVVKNRPVRAS